MKSLPPPPPIPASGVEPRASSSMVVPPSVGAANEVASTPEEFSKMLDFVNEVRRLRGLEAVAALPEATGALAAQRPLSKALGCSVIKHRDNGPFYGLVYRKEVLDAFVKLGIGAITSTPRIHRDETSMMWEVNLPQFLKPFA